MSTSPDDLTQEHAALARLLEASIEANERLMRVLVARLKHRDAANQALLQAEEDRQMDARREAWMGIATLSGAPPEIAELQWRELHDRSTRLTDAERAALGQWRAARDAELEELRQRHERTLAVLERLEQEEGGDEAMSDAKLREIQIAFLDGTVGPGRSTGNNAAWMCACGDSLPLLGTLFPANNQTVCPKCGRRYALEDGADVVTEIRGPGRG